MLRRWRLWLVLLLLLLVVGTFLAPSVYWTVVGVCRGESFYKGMPTSYWAREARTYVALPLGSPRGRTTLWLDLGGWWNTTAHRFGLDNSRSAIPPLAKGDADGLPVLLELVRNSDATVRYFAVSCLGEFAENRRVREALLVACEDEDYGVREESRTLLGCQPAPRRLISSAE